jgi:hypothetical protein
VASADVGPLLENQTTTGAGPVKTPVGPNRTYFFSAIANSGANATAAIDVQVSNDGSNWIKIGTLSFSLISDSLETNGFSSFSAWKYLRANVTSITGAGMKLNGQYGVNK